MEINNPRTGEVITTPCRGCQCREMAMTFGRLHLIAAAPDLLAVCEYALDYLNTYTADAYPPGHTTVCRNLMDAVAKAKG